ncbi:MAG: ATP-dependent [Desulfovibrionaceae bacterium]|nr:MAG: ATP-dependent [Desulfovibrionaceae bacterium]
MKIMSISAKNYRVLENVNFSFSESYCTFSGKNNAGKSCVIRLLMALFGGQTSYLWYYDEDRFNYKEDFTQWANGGDPIEICYALKLTREDDPALISFLEKIAERKIEDNETNISVNYQITSNGIRTITVKINGDMVDEKAAKEIDKRIKDSNLMFLYNSTSKDDDYIYGRSARRLVYDIVMSEVDRKEIDKAAKKLETQFKRVAKDHKQGLNTIIGRLSERYDVELSFPEGSSYNRLPLSINLKDKLVEVPLEYWGSGTQNRTRILMAILQAHRVKTTESENDKITPFVIVEEPECFLHPSAQAEFGRMLRSLSTEFGIQIIATTHSPYMLNQSDGSANILLARECIGSKTRAACVIDTSDKNWMAPFAEQLGVSTSEFEDWLPVLSSSQSQVLLVEGELDKEYFEFIRANQLGKYVLKTGVEIVPYGGWTALKNTVLLQFVLRKFDKVFITYDLDCDSEVQRSMSNLGLQRNIDYLPIGINQPGKDRLEGLLPNTIWSSVFSQETDVVLSLSSKSKEIRESAENNLKQKMLDEFRKRTDYSNEELEQFSKIFKIINKKFSEPKT